MCQTWAHIETVQLGCDSNPKPRLGLGPTVFSLKAHTLFQNLMKLRFLMSHPRRNSVGDRVIIKKWIYLESNTLQRKSVGHLRRQEALKYGVVSFYGVGNVIG